jgi:hypothetical protein
MVKGVFGSMAGLFGIDQHKAKIGALSDLPKGKNPAHDGIMDAQIEFFEANRELRRAEKNFDQAESAYINVAIDDMNIATYRVDVATRRLRIALGIEPPPPPTSEVGRSK